jgi:hypothetical protein
MSLKLHVMQISILDGNEWSDSRSNRFIQGTHVIEDQRK